MAMAAAGVASPKPGPPSGYKGGFDTGPGFNGHGVCSRFFPQNKGSLRGFVGGF